MKMTTKEYLKYLDKEMTIMGILSAISIAAPAATLNALIGDHSDLKKQIWDVGQCSIFAGSVFLVLAAFLFYKQRSRLAWFYGQICLADALADGSSAAAKLQEWLREADSWETWWPYKWGFTLLVAGSVEYGAAFLTLFLLPRLTFLAHHPWSAQLYFLALCIFAVVIVASLQIYVSFRYKFSDDRWRPLWADIEARFKRGRWSLPHEQVYARIAVSKISGVGVFAIIDIPKGTYVFEPDDDKLIKVASTEIKGLSEPLRKLYEDFCPLNDGRFECPSSFNRLTPSWYLNFSENPNLAADLSLKFYALRDIKAGEELTADYSTYSEKDVVRLKQSVVAG